MPRISHGLRHLFYKELMCGNPHAMQTVNSLREHCQSILVPLLVHSMQFYISPICELHLCLQVCLSFERRLIC